MWPESSLPGYLQAWHTAIITAATAASLRCYRTNGNISEGCVGVHAAKHQSQHQRGEWVCMLPSINGNISEVRARVHAAKHQWQHQRGVCGCACCQASMATSERCVRGCMLPSINGSIREVCVGVHAAKHQWQHQRGGCGVVLTQVIDEWSCIQIARQSTTHSQTAHLGCISNRQSSDEYWPPLSLARTSQVT
jgi:hypothetical protein